MKYANIFNTVTKESLGSMSGPRFENMLEENKGLYGLTDFEFTSEEGKVLVFRKRSSRLGDEKDIPAHFAHMPGTAAPQDHLFGAPKYESLKDAVLNGKKILLSLNLNLSYKRFDFRQMEALGGYVSEDWYRQYKQNYQTISIKSAEEAIKAIRKIAAYAPDNKTLVKDNVFALYLGGILPYESFFLGNKNERMASLYETLEARRNAMGFGKKAMGFPRILEILPTYTFYDERGAGGIKFNYTKLENDRETNSIFSKILPDPKIKNSQDHEKLEENLLALNTSQENGIRKHFYLMASPFMERETKAEAASGRKHQKMIGWPVSDIPAQVAMRIEKVKPKILPPYEYGETSLGESIELT